MADAQSVARQWLERIRGLPLHGRIRVMNVCGGHERSISMAGLRGALPRDVELIPGPGCPVCVCPEEDVHAAIQLALRKDVILVAFGDMLRVPANVPKREPRSLEQARAAGGDVRAHRVAAGSGENRLRQSGPGSRVLCCWLRDHDGARCSLVAEGLPPNLSLLLSGRLTWPAVATLLDSEVAGFDALIAPGHVSTIMGHEEWAFVPEQHNIPAAVAGFEADSLLAALYSVLRQYLEGKAFLDNCYKNVAKPGGNPTARRLMKETLDVVDANWRGIGIIPLSGFALKSELDRFDAVRRFQLDVGWRA